MLCFHLLPPPASKDGVLTAWLEPAPFEPDAHPCLITGRPRAPCALYVPQHHFHTSLQTGRDSCAPVAAQGLSGAAGAPQASEARPSRQKCWCRNLPPVCSTSSFPQTHPLLRICGNQHHRPAQCQGHLCTTALPERRFCKLMPHLESRSPIFSLPPVCPILTAFGSLLRQNPCPCPGDFCLPLWTV